MTDLEQEIADRFKRDTADHVMTVLHDDGLYRHLRCAKPGTSFYWFEIITWPGSLVFRGDMDGAPVFSRVDDMFAFFRNNGNIHGINPGYWAKKLAQRAQSVQEYSEAKLRDHVDECVAEYEKEYPRRKGDFVAAKERYDAADWADRWPMKTGGPREPDELKTPAEIRQLIEDYDSDGMLGHWDGARDLLRELEQAGVVSDTWEWDLTDWDWTYLWACHAIVWAIRQYDATPTEWLVWSNQYRAWWGSQGAGYFGDITRAGRYSRDDAIECAGRRSWASDEKPPEVVIPAPPTRMLASGSELARYLKEQIEAATRGAIESRRAKVANEAMSTAPLTGIETVSVPGVTR